MPFADVVLRWEGFSELQKQTAVDALAPEHALGLRVVQEKKKYVTDCMETFGFSRERLSYRFEPDRLTLALPIKCVMARPRFAAMSNS